jgi:sec-independent protein translocase protein TatA
MDTGMLAEIFGPDGVIVIAVLAVVLIFGGRKLPELARGLGSASHEFKKGIAEDEGEASKPELMKPPNTPVH